MPRVATGSTLHQELVCRILRGAPGAGTFPFTAEFQSQFLRYTSSHGVQPLLYAQVQSSDAWDGWPSDLRQALTSGAASQAVLDMIQGQETVNVLDALIQSGVKPLLMKGAPLAYTHYRSPHLRPRGDTDVLIRRDDREIARTILAELGYERRNTVSGELVSYQDSWSKLDRLGVAHVIDLHWRVNNCQMFAEAVSYDELANGSVAVPLLGARALGPAHALLVACMHRVAHITAPWWSVDGTLHYGDRLIWLYDIHLLASRMSPQELAGFARLAVERRLKTICLDGLRRSQRCFATPLPDEVLELLSAPSPMEPSAPYLDPGRLRSMVRDIRSLPTWRDRLRLTQEHLFPPAGYLQKKYGVSRARLAASALSAPRNPGDMETAPRVMRFRKFVRFSSTQRRLLLAGALVVVCARSLLWLLPFKRLVWLVERTALRPARVAPRRMDEDTIGNIAWAVTTAARYVPRATCLTQALAAQWLFAWFGHPTMLRIGVAKGSDKALKAHAWLESEGAVVVGGEALDGEVFAVLPLPFPGAVHDRTCRDATAQALIWSPADGWLNRQ